ncbi:hypothetical protein GCM10010885_15430 [Alicyclobacillus cellulosilyticus]|uniref:Methyltransferase family protein n=1 Tax=Alicyclobacillus cellulosilyticus TaxID=1003997 RepID=A0A917KAT7_9BACL|nr:SAM-dependent methyltransferase [Alicyclobacillus cellulosilyticus]GGJ07199.1 hypothetical protein GCM10010885_15430 [Alicyclobacillus cellulosilyticus]
MFDLTEDDLRGRAVLDCPAGACSFTAVARAHGVNAIAADIAYDHSVDELERKGREDIEHTMEAVQRAAERYRWEIFRDVDHLRQARMEALAACVADMRQHPSRYVPVVLPDLPFSDARFDMTLSAHFLFMYSDRLDEAFHRATLAELMRVTRHQVRIFPTVDLHGRRYEHMDALLAWARTQGWEAREVRVPYEFQRNAHTMLVLNKVGLSC